MFLMFCTLSFLKEKKKEFDIKIFFGTPTGIKENEHNDNKGLNYGQGKEKEKFMMNKLSKSNQTNDRHS